MFKYRIVGVRFHFEYLNVKANIQSPFIALLGFISGMYILML